MEVTFTKKFAYASYLNLDLGGSKNTTPISAEGQCEDTKESFFAEADRLNDWCNEWFKTRYGEYEEQRGTVEKIIGTAPEVIKEEQKSKEENLIEQIDSCSSVKILQVFKKIIEKIDNPVVTKAYNKKLKELK